MRYFLIMLLGAGAGLGSDRDDAIATVNKTFQAMKTRDEKLLRSTMLPEARLYAVREAVSSRTLEEFVTQIAGSKVGLIERFVGRPRVAVHGRMAQVWGEYEFWRDGKFSHCGVDSAVLFKGAEGWKIATLSYTVETTGCKGHAK